MARSGCTNEETSLPKLSCFPKTTSSLRLGKPASYADTEKAISRFSNCTFIPFENGGHLLTDHGEEIKKAISEFIQNKKPLTGA